MGIRIFDKQLELRDGTAAAITSTTSETGINVDLTALTDYKVAINVTALDTADADEVYTLTIETDSLAAFTDAPVVQGTVVVATTGRHIVSLNRDNITKLDANAAAIRVKATLAGTTPSITYGAFLVAA